MNNLKGSEVMNELNTRLLEYLPDPNTVKGGIGSVVEVLQIEAPLLVSELVRWEIVKNLPVQVFCLCVILLAIVLWKKHWRKTLDSRGDIEPDIFMPFAIITGIVCIPCAFGFCLSFGWIKPLVAQRLFLLEYVSNLL